MEDAARDDAARWARAHARLGQGAPPEDELRARRRRRRVWIVAGVFVLVAVGAGFVVGALSADRPEPPSDLAPWREVIGVVLASAGLLGVIVAGVLAWRAGVWRGLSSWPTRGLSRAQQRHMTREVQGRAPVDPEHLPLARALARRLQLQGRLRPMWASLCLMQLGQLISADSWWRTVFPAVALLFLLAAVAGQTFQVRRAERFLAAHPAGAREG